MTTKTYGKQGEDIAVKFLEKKGYRILTTNFYSRFGEIDIIAQKDNNLVFIEVKTRSSNLFGTPSEAITKKKISKMIKTADYYRMISKQQNKSYSFDAIEILFEDGIEKTTHIENITL